MRDPLAPDDVDGVGAVAIGTVLWTVALVVAVIMRDALEAAGRGWWIWVCAAGATLGLPGLWYVTRRRDRYRTSGASSGS